ncbi:TIGR02186 family protein [Hwanghaeella sp. LZ110]|uniref:TIGR02186 family protein n=1 Tax=Hwanghaeella sp. LZ110 TaxID=3402810 RepID=UPI003B67DA32
MIAVPSPPAFRLRLSWPRCILSLFLLIPASLSADEPLVADLDNHLVAITAGFTGEELLLFGTMQGDGDIVVVVHGPKQDIVARRKDRVAGIWMNTESVEFKGVPSFYSVATTAKSGLDLPPSALRRHQIGLENIRLQTDDILSQKDYDQFAASVLRNKVAIGLFSPDAGVVERRGRQLFRASVLIPTNVPVGTYTVETLLVRDGQVAAAQTTPLFVNKEGFGAQVYRTAYMQPALYGLAAIFIAGFAGLAANWIFQKL